jgi:hypothetical protein
MLDEHRAREVGNAYDELCDLAEKVASGYATENEKYRHDAALLIVQEDGRSRSSHRASQRSDQTGPIVLFFVWLIVGAGTLATIVVAAHFLKLAVIAFGGAAMLR